MRTALNRLIHGMARKLRSSTPFTAQQKKEALHKAITVQKEIKAWNHDGAECISLGQNCSTSWYLKKNGLKKTSYPFDWIFTTPEIIVDLLDTDLNHFMDVEQLIPHGLDAGHERYHETLFGHRNPASKQGDRAYFDRCIKRWHERMSSERPITFVTTVINESDKRKRWKQGFTKNFRMPENQCMTHFEAMMDRIQKIHSHSKFLFLEQYTGSDFELAVDYKEERAIWIRFMAIDENTGVEYLNPLDDEVMCSVIKGLDSA